MRRPVSPYGETTSSAPARTSLPIEALGGTGDDPQVRVERPGGEGDEHVGRVGINRADQAPGALDAGLPEHALVGRIA